MAGTNDFRVYRFWIDFPTCDQPRMSLSFSWISFLLSAAIAPPSVADFGVEYKKAGKTSQRKLGDSYSEWNLLRPGSCWVLPGAESARYGAAGSRRGGESFAIFRNVSRASGIGASQRRARSLAGRNLEGFTGAP